MSAPRRRYTPGNPGPVANSFSRYVRGHFVGEYPELENLTPAVAQAFFSYHNEWQRWRNQPGGEADQEKQGRDSVHIATTAVRKPSNAVQRTTRLGANADPAVVAAKMARIREPHVAPLNELADDIAAAKRLPGGHIPYIDPDFGGIEARALMLLDNPSTQAEAGTGSGLLSLDNNDHTARNLREALDSQHIARTDLVSWNVVPFPVAGRNGGSTGAEQRAGAPWIREFVRRCPSLEFVLLLGVAARKGWQLAGLAVPVPVVSWPVPHCSRKGLAGLNSVDARSRFDDAIAQLATVLRDE